MSRTILTEIDGWTPIIDDVVQEVGLTAAAVFGVIWRFCQMEKGVCMASQTTIAEKLGISRQTVNTCAKKLSEYEFIEEISDEVGMTVTYMDTGKAGMSNKITGGVKNFDRGCQKILQGGVKKFDTKILFKETKDTCDVSKSETSQRAKDGVDMTLDYLRNKDENIINSYPEEVRETLRTFIKYWPVDIPEKTKRQNGKWAQWLNELRDINKACAEFGLVIISYAYEEYNKNPWIVDHPGATIKVIRSVVANKRKEKDYTGKVEY